MADSVKKKLFFLVFCLASVAQGMYSTYFVSILTTIERIYQIQSKTAGAIMSATEIGQILGSLLIAYYGGRGNKPKWIASCMILTAIAALISTTPHFIFKLSTTHSSTDMMALENSPYLTNDLTNNNSPSPPLPQAARKINLPSQDHLCYLNNMAEPVVLNSTHSLKHSASVQKSNSTYREGPIGSILVIFFLCLLAIGFGSTALTTLGIPYIDDIVSKEESPLYLGLSIGLKIFGPALGFLLGSFCIRLDVNLLSLDHPSTEPADFYSRLPQYNSDIAGVGAWWLGLIIISLPLLILAFPMYYLSRSSTNDIESSNEFEAITYQAAEDHDIGGSSDFQTHVLTMGDLDVTSNRTCYSDMDSSSREVLQAKPSTSSQFHYNFGKNIALDRPIITKESMLNKSKDEADSWQTSCVVVNHFGGLKSTSFTKEEAKSLRSSSYAPSSSSSSISTSKTLNLSSTLSRLIKNKLLLLRMLSCILHILPIAGFYTFLPKYLTEQFGIAPSSASAISGLAGILFVGLGAFLGGMIIRLLNVNSRLMTRWIATSALFYALGMLILMNLGCPQNQAISFESDEFTSTDCLNNCRCLGSIYNPVCSNGTTYMSPCLAGCKSYKTLEGKIVFEECGCSYPLPGVEPNQPSLNVATSGHCSLSCDNLKWYIILFSLFTLIHASCEVGSMMFNLRCVDSRDRTLALGLVTFSSSLFGTIPCSVMYGTIIDLTCIYWDKLSYQENQLEDNTMRGACRAYKNDTFRYYLHGVTAIVMFLAFLVDCIISRRANEVDFYEKDDSKKDTSLNLKKSTETI